MNLPKSTRSQALQTEPSSTAKAGVREETLDSADVVIERKTFLLDLKENPRGRFLRITEEREGRRNSVIIPATGLRVFKQLVDRMVSRAEETAPHAE